MFSTSVGYYVIHVLNIPVSGRIGDPIELGTLRPQFYVELGTLKFFYTLPDLESTWQHTYGEYDGYKDGWFTF